jgi:hypothetical protein
MQYSFFIRSCHKDFCWLEYCFLAIKKNWKFTGDEEIVLCYPRSDIETYRNRIGQIIDQSGLKIRLVQWEECAPEGYNDQQVNKIYADTYCHGEYVVFVDSDCILVKPGAISDLFVNGKPMLLHESWDRVGPAICWKERAEWVMEHSLEFEFMRRLPFIIKREHLTNLREYLCEIHGKELRDVVCIRKRMISEFNIMGDFVYQFHPSEYHLIELNGTTIPFTPWQQEWSHNKFEERKPILEALLSQS